MNDSSAEGGAKGFKPPGTNLMATGTTLSMATNAAPGMPPGKSTI